MTTPTDGSIGVTISCIKAVRTARHQEQLIASWTKTQAVVTGSRQGWSPGAGNATPKICYWPGYEYHDSRGVLYVGESGVSFRGQASARVIPGGGI